MAKQQTDQLVRDAYKFGFIEGVKKGLRQAGKYHRDTAVAAMDVAEHAERLGLNGDRERLISAHHTANAAKMQQLVGEFVSNGFKFNGEG